jgi:alkanesulfonate monooxygenase SsuD/methylene tetrahydromethanopterin reductase-like flavin-dependent oxidoreductase (luciferase family)
MNALWNDQHVVFKGKWHAIEDAGINPRPKGKIPLWFGGHADVTLQRTAKWGDGWIMLAHAAGKEAETEFAKLRRYVKEEGRDPRDVGIEVWVSTAEGSPDDWRKEFAYWKSVGVTHVTVNSTYARGPHKRIAGKTMADHLKAMKDYHAAVKDLV